jgi:DNA-binding NarL/FixJ family response regulator
MAPRILIVDDHQIVRQGVRALLADMRPDWEICGEAENASEALNAIRSLGPDLTVLDITMPGASGLELASQVRTLGLPGKILIFTMHHSERLLVDVRAAGAQGYVLKSQAARDLVYAIERLLAGGTFYGGASEREPDPQPNPHGDLAFCSPLAFAAI